MRRSSSLPERPTKGSPARSSSRPGPSPTKSRSAVGEPTPKTTCVRPFARAQSVHVDAVTRSRSSASTSSALSGTGLIGAVDDDARHARPDAAHHLVADRPHHGGPVIRRDDLLTLPSEQHHLVARLDRAVLAAVDDDLVHRHRTGQGTAPAADEDLEAALEEGTRHPV